MNTLFSRTHKCFSHKFIISSRKYFSASIVASLEKNSISGIENSEVLNKLLQKDDKFFINLSNNRGPEFALSQLESATATIDSSTKLGRDLLKVKDEIVTRLAYNLRTVDEHEHASTHICEKELFKVYNEHLKTLEAKTEWNKALSIKNTSESQVLYEYSNSSPKYTIIPVATTGLSILFLNVYSAPIVQLFGASSPILFSFVAVYAGLKRMQWLRGGDRLLKGSTLVKKLTLNGDFLLVEDFNKKTHNLSLSSSNIYRIDNDIRREIYYIIKDSLNSTKFILPITEDASADEKSLSWFSQIKKNNEEYSIRHVLLQGQSKIIDTNKNKNLKSEIDTFARMNILSSKGAQLSTLTPLELQQKLGQVADIEVREYLNQVDGRFPQHSPIQSNLQSVENLLVSFGINQVEAIKMTKYLRESYRISRVNDLANISSQELSDAYSETVKNSEIDYKSFKKSLDTFFESLRH